MELCWGQRSPTLHKSSTGMPGCLLPCSGHTLCPVLCPSPCAQPRDSQAPAQGGQEGSQAAPLGTTTWPRSIRIRILLSRCIELAPGSWKHIFAWPSYICVSPKDLTTWFNAQTLKLSSPSIKYFNLKIIWTMFIFKNFYPPRNNV